jgi:hypothetical protein
MINSFDYSQFHCVLFLSIAAAAACTSLALLFFFFEVRGRWTNGFCVAVVAAAAAAATAAYYNKLTPKMVNYGKIAFNSTPSD